MKNISKFYSDSSDAEIELAWIWRNHTEVSGETSFFKKKKNEDSFF